ncbi:MAG: hypothetical protein A3D32_04120 [Candidatus Muproteobacteria bacterium RIFCSPHIGHO2_02_FULL_60_13]|nr:MAG: hypothetical protein A3D32_04120 [Candidatus Muproteobacteria bacterium RIFCSPHIGHO2_02_FULL_60_13]
MQKFMLSFLYRLVEHYHREHGLHPNLLYLNQWHYQKLLECIPEMESQEEVSRFLMMQIIVSPEAVHPHVAWLPGNVSAGHARQRERIL